MVDRDVDHHVVPLQALHFMGAAHEDVGPWLTVTLTTM
jgi:hypothetical protein